MMFPPNWVQIMVATKPFDVHKGYDTLAARVSFVLRKDPFTDTVFMFRSCRADRLKMLNWSGSGLVMTHKRMKEATFTWPAVKDGHGAQPCPVIGPFCRTRLALSEGGGNPFTGCGKADPPLGSASLCRSSIVASVHANQTRH
jgi:transposase